MNQCCYSFIVKYCFFFCYLLNLMLCFSYRAADTGNERMQNDVVDDEVRAPLPVVRETLYGDSMYYGLVSFSTLASCHYLLTKQCRFLNS